MCCIGGVLTVYQYALKTIIQQMQIDIRHRSPDDSTIYILSKKQPDWVVNPAKGGFSFPFKQSTSGEWCDYSSDVNIRNNISFKFWYRRWNLAILKYSWEGVAK